MSWRSHPCRGLLVFMTNFTDICLGNELLKNFDVNRWIYLNLLGQFCVGVFISNLIEIQTVQRPSLGTIYHSSLSLKFAGVVSYHLSL